MNVWQRLKKEQDASGTPRPLIVLAPMADVTDIAFRTLISEKGNPDMMWTEFVSADGLVRASAEGRGKLLRDLKFNDKERPIVAQLFGSNPVYMEQAAYLVALLGFDGIDINMGCPDRSIEKQGAGASMMKNPEKALQIIAAAKAGAKRAFDEVGGVGSMGVNGVAQTDVADKDAGAENSASAANGASTDTNVSTNVGANANTNIGDEFVQTLIRENEIRIIDKNLYEEPIAVSVKTRIGYNKNELETWIPALLSAKPALITVHCRTRKEMSLVPARWEHLSEAIAIRDSVQADLLSADRTLIIGNGDITSVPDGIAKARAQGADGAMLGRALFGNPWLFSGLKRDVWNSAEIGAGDSAGDSAEKNLAVDAEIGTGVPEIGTPAETAHGSAEVIEFDQYHPTILEKINTAIRHTELFVEHLGDIKNFAIMKKHFKAYINGFDHAKELRVDLMDNANCVDDVKRIIAEHAVKTNNFV